MDTRPRHPVPLSAYLIALSVAPVLVAALFALVALSRHPDNESDRAAADALSRRAPAVERAIADEGERLERLATVLARDPKFYASLTLPKGDRGRREFRDALESVLRDFQRDARTPIFAVTDEKGVLLSRALPPDDPTDLTKAPFVLDAVRGRPGHGVLIEMGMAYRVVAVPVTAGGVVVGSLCLGTALDTDVAGALKEAIGADVMFTIGEAVASTTLAPSPIRKSLAQRIGDRSLDTSGLARSRPPASGDPARPAPDVDVVGASGARYLAYHRSIDAPTAGGGPLGFVLIRPLESAPSPLVLLRRDLWKATGVGLLAALLAGGGIAGLVFVRHRRVERAHEVERTSLEARRAAAESLLADVATALREPASSIATAASFLGTPELGLLSNPQQEGLMDVARDAGSIEGIVRDLEDLGGLQRRALEPSLRAADVGALVERATADLIPAAARRGQTLSFVAEPGLHHDRVDEVLFQRAIESVVRCVLGTAPHGTRVLVEAGRVEGAIAVAVGAAAPPDASARQSGRLLVALARAIVDAHGGAFHERDMGEGRLAYVLRLPSPIPTALPSEPTAPPSPTPAPQPTETEPLSLAS